jgi:hypothetical protein
MSTLLNQAGNFRGHIKQHTIDKTDGGALVLNILHAVEEIWTTPEGGTEPCWCDWRQYDLEITGYHYLTDKTGKPSKTRDQAMLAFGWDGKDLPALADMDLSQIVAQFTVKMDEYQGKVRPKVTWLAPGDADPTRTLQRPDAGKWASIVAEFGPKLRAHAGPSAPGGNGGTKPPAKLPTIPRPTPAQAKPAAPAPSPNTAPTATANDQQAWEAVLAANAALPDPLNEVALAGAWSQIVAKVAPGMAQETITPAQWGRIVAEAAALLAEYVALPV